MKHEDIDHTGIPGVGGSGSVATDAIWDAAGDLAVGSGADTAARLAIGAAGLLLKSNGTTATWALPTLRGCKVYNDATQAVNTTNAALTFNQEEWDSDGYHDTGSNTGRITIPSGLGGKYLLQGGTFASASWSWIGFKKTVSGPTTTAIRGYSLAPSAAAYASASAIVSLAAGDYVELWVNTLASCNLGHASLPDAQSWFSATLIGV